MLEARFNYRYIRCHRSSDHAIRHSSWRWIASNSLVILQLLNDSPEPRTKFFSSRLNIHRFLAESPDCARGIGESIRTRSSQCSRAYPGLRLSKSSMLVLPQIRVEFPTACSRVARISVAAETKCAKHLKSARTTICGVWYPEGLIAYLAGVRPLVILAHGAELLTAREPLEAAVLECFAASCAGKRKPGDCQQRIYAPTRIQRGAQSTRRNNSPGS